MKLNVGQCVEDTLGIALIGGQMWANVSRCEAGIKVGKCQYWSFSVKYEGMAMLDKLGILRSVLCCQVQCVCI